MSGDIRTREGADDLVNRLLEPMTGDPSVKHKTKKT